MTIPWPDYKAINIYDVPLFSTEPVLVDGRSDCYRQSGVRVVGWNKAEEV